MVSRRWTRIIASFVLAIPAALALNCDQQDSAYVVDAGDPGSDVLSNLSDAASSLEDAGIGPCPIACSEDLRSIVDCHGVSVTTCAENEGCFEGACMDACEAAAKQQGGRGCDFYASPPPPHRDTDGRCYAIAVNNTWSSPVHVAVDYRGASLDVESFARIPGDGRSPSYTPLPNGEIPPGKVALLFLGSSKWGEHQCPKGVTAATEGQPIQVPGTGIGHAFHIVTDRPVFMNDYYPYSQSTVTQSASATSILPTTAWSTNYLAQTPYMQTIFDTNNLFVQIVAKDDDTSIDIQPTVDIVGNVDAGIPGATKDSVVSYTLNRGEVLQLVQSEELVGSTIVSSKPVGVWGGATLMSVDVDMEFADGVHQQIAPIRALGWEYPAVTYRSRLDGVNENTPWRIVGVVDGTVLTYDPKKPAKAPDVINKGEVATFWFEGPMKGEPPFRFIVRSQGSSHPFYFWSYMTGAKAGPLKQAEEGGGMGDPEWIAVTPTQQYRSSYLFYTDPTFPETNLVVVRQKVAGAFHDVTLDCAGTLSGWTPLGTSGSLEFTRIDLVRYIFEGQNGCHLGTHTMTSTGPFGLTLWGWGSSTWACVSYAYSPGIAARTVTDARVTIIK